MTRAPNHGATAWTRRTDRRIAGGAPVLTGREVGAELECPGRTLRAAL